MAADAKCRSLPLAPRLAPAFRGVAQGVYHTWLSDDNILGYEDEAFWKERTDARWDADIELDEEDDAVPVYVGMRVRHPKFGIGKVAGWDGTGPDMKLHLRFSDRPRTILARFCEPE